MKNLIKIEELFFTLLTIYLFLLLEYAWWWYPLLFFTPDLSMLGYLISPQFGAATYNLIHHRGVSVAVYILGGFLSLPVLQLIGLIILGHSSFDRVFGYGLKYSDSFQHTHLGMIGRAARESS